MFSRLQEVVRQGIEKKIHLGVQVSISYQGECFEQAYGHSSPGTELEVDSKLLWLSAGKPLTAIAILILQQRGCLSINDSISKYFPGFSDNGKEQITISHFLSHTAGLEDLKTGWPETNSDQIIKTLCSAPLKKNWVPGQRAAYVPAASWVLLGNIVAQTSGMPFEDFIQQEILNPLGMHETVCVHQGKEKELAGQLQMYDRDQGELQVSGYVDRILKGVPLPGSCFVGPASDLRKFYDAMRSDSVDQSKPLLNPELLSQLTVRHREGLVDETFQHMIDFGLGVIMNSNRYGLKTVPYGYGEKSSENAFGHGGSQSSIGFADPQRNMSVVIVANGRPGEGQHQRRFRLLLAAMEEDLLEIG